MSLVTGLRCRACGKTKGKDPVAACDDCWAGLEPMYDMDRVRETFTKEAIAARPRDPRNARNRAFHLACSAVMRS